MFAAWEHPRHELRSQADVIGNGLMPLSPTPSRACHSQCASERVEESSYNDPTNDETSCDQRSDSSSSHDEYVPSPSESSDPPQNPSTPLALSEPLLGPDATGGSEYTTPSQRSTQNISDKTKDALHRLYRSPDCVVTRKDEGVICAHIVRRRSTPEELTLYEYCLGLEYLSFHVHSRRNLIKLDLSTHFIFDQRKWLFLPELQTLQEVKSFVQSVLAARKSSDSEIKDFTSKWTLNHKISYRLMPLTPKFLPIFRPRPNPLEPWEQFSHPFTTFPPIECYVSPPLAVINGGPKFNIEDVDGIASRYVREEGNTQLQVQVEELGVRERLNLLSEIWGLIEGAKGDAEEWREVKRGKRKRDPGDDEIEPNSPKSSGVTTRSMTNAQGKSEPTRQTNRETRSGTRKRDMTRSLTGDMLAQLGKRYGSFDNKRIMEWVEGTARLCMK